MDDIKVSLSNRTKNRYPISIGTSLALESYFPTDNPDLVERTTIAPIISFKYDALCININTLVRNILNAAKLGFLKDRNILNTNIELLANILTGEINIINGIAENNNYKNIIFYYIDYYKLKGIIPIRETGSVQAELQLMNRLIKRLKQSLFLYLPASLRNESLYKSLLILTHQPHDLLAYKYYDKFSLLESHTGVVKDKTIFNTKYVSMSKGDLTRLPFNHTLLGIFGDNHLIQPANVLYRKQVLEIATMKKWTPLTTETKVLHDLKEIKNG